MRRHAHRSEVQLGARRVVVETALDDGSELELVTQYTESNMTIDQKRLPLKGLGAERSARDEASLTRQVSASHLGAVHELLGQLDDGQDVQTAQNLRSKGQILEPQGVLLAFCLSHPPDEQTFASRRVSCSWLETTRRVDALARATAEAFGNVAVDHIIVHGEGASAFLARGAKGTRACIIDSTQGPSDNAIVARLEAIQCGP